MRENDIFLSFIQTRLNSYNEPQRKDTPRGEPIGFSKKKFHASMLMLTGKNLEEIAAKVRVNEGTVRNWNSDEEFRQLTIEHARSFVEYYISLIDTVFIKENIKGEEFSTFEQVKSLLLESLKLRSMRKIKTKEKGVPEYREELRKAYIELAIEILSSPDLSEEKRKEVLALLSFYKSMYN